jgi:hypothetical protein
MVFLNSPEDMKWLRDVHLQGLPSEYEAAVVHGNEDSPSKIEVFRSLNPTVNEKPAVFLPGLNGRFEVQLDI